MTKNRSVEIKVGVVSILAVILFVMGMIFGKEYTVTSTYHVKIRFPNSGGIQPSSPVVVNGVPRGSVSSVENDKGSVLITAKMDEIDDLNADVRARITIQELTGGKKIELYPGNSSEPFSIKHEIPGNTPPDIAELIVILGNVSQDAVSLIRRLDTISVAAVDVINDRQTLGEIKEIISNTREMTENLNSYLRDNNHKLRETTHNLYKISADIKEIIDKNDPRLDTLMDNLNYSLIKTRSLLASADTAVYNANSMMLDLKDISSEIKTGEGLASRLIYDKEFAFKLERTLDSLASFIVQVKKYGVNINARIGTRP